MSDPNLTSNGTNLLGIIIEVINVLAYFAAAIFLIEFDT